MFKNKIQKFKKKERNISQRIMPLADAEQAHVRDRERFALPEGCTGLDEAYILAICLPIVYVLKSHHTMS